MEKACPWFCESQYADEVVENERPYPAQAFDDVVENERPSEVKNCAEVVENEPSFPTQTPFTAKQPAAILKPLENVDVAPPNCVSAPVLEILKSVVVALAVEEEIAKRVVFVSPAFAETESFAFEEVERAPRSTWLVVVVMRTPELLKNDQLPSLPEPPPD